MPPLPRQIDPNSSDNNRVAIYASSILKWVLSMFSIVATVAFVLFLNNDL